MITKNVEMISVLSDGYFSEITIVDSVHTCKICEIKQIMSLNANNSCCQTRILCFK